MKDDYITKQERLDFESNSNETARKLLLAYSWRRSRPSWLVRFIFNRK